MHASRRAVTRSLFVQSRKGRLVQSAKSSGLFIPPDRCYATQFLNSCFTSTTQSLVTKVSDAQLSRGNQWNLATQQRNYAKPVVSSRQFDNTKVRNFAIVAHVDTGKTTLVDCLLKQTKAVKATNEGGEERMMDSMQLERERGITIMAKVTSVHYDDYFFNIVDTPGHADFGGEVERIMGMVDGVCLLVDATDGPMTQTRFVLKKALEYGLRPIVVINKADRDTARIGEVENEIFDLFVSLEANDYQLDFPILYSSAKEGWSVKDMKDERLNMKTLFDTVIESFPAPTLDPEPNFKMLATNLEYDRHFGRIMTGKIHGGKVRIGDKVKVVTSADKQIEEGKVTLLMMRRGMEKIKIEEAFAGEIISIAGLTKANVTDTICAPEVLKHVPAKPLDPPIISVIFSPNDSPLAGREGEHVSPVKMRDRLTKEAEINIALTIKPAEGDSFEVMGRGEMQLGILIEQMRREGFEFQISPPRVLLKTGENGEELEPIEEVIIDCENDHAPTLMENMSRRIAELKDFKVQNGRGKIMYNVPTRTFIGFTTDFRMITGGTGVINHIFHSFQPYWGGCDRIRRGAMISMARGATTAYALEALEPRGVLFIKPQIEVYEGMVIGENSREQDIEVNPCKEKHLTNVRAAGKEDAIRLQPPRVLPIEEVLAYVQADEMVEVTPKNVRLRKKLLSSNDRKKAGRTERNKNAKV